MSRYFAGLERFASFCLESAELQSTMLKATAGLSSVVMQRKAKSIFGDPSRLASLAQATQDERVRLGYAANEPLLRDGELLRDSVEAAAEAGVEEAVAGIGSKEPVMSYHEYGYVNARTGNPVPPRPVFKIAMVEAAPEIAEILQRAIRVSLGLSSFAIKE